MENLQIEFYLKKSVEVLAPELNKINKNDTFGEQIRTSKGLLETLIP